MQLSANSAKMKKKILRFFLSHCKFALTISLSTLTEMCANKIIYFKIIGKF